MLSVVLESSGAHDRVPCRHVKALAMKRWFVVLVFALLAPAVGTCAEHVRTLYLVRHGAYEPNPKADPQLGPSLTPLGIAQARLIGARLRGMPVHFDSMTSSAMTRAR